MLFARRYSAPQALVAGIVDEVASAELLLERAVDYAQALVAQDRTTRGTIKRRLYAPVLRALRADFVWSPLPGQDIRTPPHLDQPRRIAP